MKEELIAKVSAELAALSDDAKGFVYLILAETGIAREHLLPLGARFAGVFSGPAAAKVDTSDLELRLKTALENNAALGNSLSSANAEASGLCTQLEAALAQITALEEAATAPTLAPAPEAPTKDPLAPPEPAKDAESSVPSPDATPAV